MRITIAAIGRARRGPEADLYQHYAGRITPPPTLKEVEEKRPLAGDELKRREADLLRAALPDGATVVALDARGKSLSSMEFEKKLSAWRDGSVRDLAFVIGGADGLDDALLKGADFVLSLGPLTWPHLMVRGMLAEQLYRAQCIGKGHPYHRE